MADLGSLFGKNKGKKAAVVNLSAIETSDTSAAKTKKKEKSKVVEANVDDEWKSSEDLKKNVVVVSAGRGIDEIG